ncbi:MAG: deoxyribose-phosphate aldolase [Tannerella sp.]|jgi:deoxyribose-phosphate aldolase|nr:deoxyribose-phosphate aldolase [Tannerella sp.]
MERTKYFSAFQSFKPVEAEQTISSGVQDILNKSFIANFTPKVLATLYGCLDLTTLNSTDTKDTVFRMVAQVNQFEGTCNMPNVAAICTFPVFVEVVKQSLLAKDVKIASVAAGFPSSQTFLEIKIAETELAIKAGADEIDIVLNLRYFMEGAYDELTDELSAIKESCRGAQLKVIIETGALVTPENIQRATILSLYSGADFIKTSTGKCYPGASPEAFYVICQTVKQYHKLTGNRVGVKVSGGIRTADEAVKYYTIAEWILGKEWLNKDLFRVGASSLATDILHRFHSKSGESIKSRCS